MTRLHLMNPSRDHNPESLKGPEGVPQGVLRSPP